MLILAVSPGVPAMSLGAASLTGTEASIWPSTQLGPDQVLGPGVARAHLDGKSDDVSGAVIGQGRRHAEVAVAAERLH